MTQAQDVALLAWAESVKERSAIEEFIDWVVSERIGEIRFSMSRSDILDIYYGINRRDLEAARRELLRPLEESL